MEKNLPQRVHDYMEEHLHQKHWRRVVTAMACIVVFCTTYALILPAITATGDTYCGKEEHTHSEECYERVLICGSEGTDAEESVQTGDQTESEFSDGTSDEISDGISDGTSNETPSETPDENLDGASDETPDETLDETPDETEDHVHTDACYEKKLVCQLEEHTHTLACYSNPEADVENSGVWENTIPQNLGDNWAENVVAVAKSQLGYTESTANYTVLEDGTTMKGYTRYGEWYGSPYDDWSAMFVSFCLNYAGVPNTSVPYASDCADWINQLQNAGLYKSAAQCIPEPGFPVFFDTDGDGAADHAGIVTEISEDGATLSIVEGDITDAVVQRSCSTGDGTILGYCVLPENPDAQKDEAVSDGEEDKTADEAVSDGGEDKTADETVSDGEEDKIADETTSDGEEDKTTDETVSEDDITTAEVLQDDVVDGGTIQGGDYDETTGKYNEITWTVTRDDSGELTLTISGEGSMADYDNQTRPWEKYRSGTTFKKISIGNGVTKIGNYSFCRLSLQSIEIGKDVKVIGERAFSYCGSLSDYDLNIPGTVEEIQQSAFAMTKVKSVTLNEGTVTIANDQFFGKDGGMTVYIPSTVKKIGTVRPFNTVSKFIVSENNPKFTTDAEGIALFDKDQTTLYGFTCRHLKEYRIPDTVTSLNYVVFETNNCERLIIPTSVTSTWQSIMGNIKEIIFADGTGKESSLIIGGFSWGGSDSSELTTYRLPKNRPLVLGGLVKGNWPNVTEFEIPNGVTRFSQNLTDGSMLGLKTLHYNAKSATFDAAATSPCGPDASFALTIGNEVDTLAEGFSYFVNHATSFVFESNNQITIADGAFANAPAPLTGLSGTVYVDSQGVVYSYDASAGTAKLVYVPGNVTEVIIPESITPEDGVNCKVTSVGSNALCLAEKLTAITFEKPEAITEIGAYGLANCPSLTSVNGKETVDKASAIFTQAVKGYGILDNTGLQGSSGSGMSEKDMNGAKDLTIVKEDTSYLEIKLSSKGETLEWKENENGGGGYTLLTGDTMTITAAAGNTQGNTEYVYRVYLRKSGEDCALGFSPGETYTFNDSSVICCATDDPNTIYLQFVPGIGNTMSFPITAVYPSPGSAGGGLTIWGEVLTDDEAKDKTSADAPNDGKRIDAFWKTQRDPYTLIKKLKGEASANIIIAKDGTARPESSLVWTVSLNRDADTTSAYGKDIAKSVDLTDQLTLPEGLSWSKTVLEAINEGTICARGNNIYAGDTKIATIAGDNGANWSGRGVLLSEDKQNLIFRWKSTNTSRKTELGSTSGTITVYPEALEADVEKLGENGATLTNTANATVHYTYSADDTLSSSVDRQLIPKKGTLTLSKSAEGGYYFGEDITYTVTLKNNGLTEWTGDADSCLVRDTMSQWSYISPENIEKMFKDTYDNDLTITISKATLAAWKPVSATDGVSTSYRTSGNSDIGTSGQTLTITKSGDNYTVSVKGDNTPYTADSVREALQRAGYAVTRDATYICEWKMDKAIPANTTYEFKVYATAKDTFGMLWNDWPGGYDNKAVNIPNWANLISVKGGKENELKSARADASIHREAVISKSVYDEKNNKLDGYTASDGAVLNYQLDFTHYGSGKYDNLPMVDDLYGSQYLLVPTEQNPGLAEMGLQTKKYNEVTYYILTEGTYTDIVVGEDDEENWLTAATVTVTKTETEEKEKVTGNSYTGIHTQIKWYFAHLAGGHYRKSVRYQAVEDLSITGVSYSLGNIVWMNDRTGDRIYATVTWGNGTLIKYDKSIVETKGSEPAQDVLDNDDYSMIAPGDKVTYRLTLESDADTTYTINGRDLIDMLPETYNVFTWERDTNISLETVKTENVEVTKINSWELVAPKDTKIVLSGERQCITWPEDTTISFKGRGTLYIYVTLTFPKDTEDTGDTWSQYAAANAGKMLDNTLYVYRFTDSVEHELRESGSALLQKGVLAQTIYDDYNNFYATGSDRQSYANNDGNKRAVFYYVALYNDGNKRLYLNDLQDKLPTGFTYLRMLPEISQASEKDGWKIQTNDTTTTVGGTSSKLINLSDIADGEDVKYRSAVVTAVPSEDKTGITFQISAGSGEYALKYDEKKQQYYLDRNEGLVFAYAADVGTVKKTENVAVNTVAMPYTDHLSTGVTQPGQGEVEVNAVTSGRFGDFNDGDRKILTSDTVQQQYGFTGEETNWFVSSVSLERGSIVPGITKYTESYIEKTSGNEYDYKNAVGPGDTVNWRIRVQNTGTVSMTDYTVTDVMPKPYVFTGDVKYTIYDSQGRSLSDGCFFSFKGERTSQDTSVSITDQWYGSKALSLQMGGTETWLGKNGDEVSVAIKRDETSKNESLTLHIQTLNRSIPEGGYMDITFSSVNPTTDYTNSVYINQATVTPNQQKFTNAGQGSIVRDSSGNAVSVRNSAPVTVTFGYATSSEKSVTQTDDTSNTAVSTDMEKNWILLPSAESEFRYTLTVHNDTEKAMTKLVLIDNLPGINDHSPFNSTAERNSEFDVNFAEDPNVKVVVTDENGNSSELDKKYYKVKYSKSTDFGGQQSNDWKGEDTEKWDSLSTDARSLRIVITDTDGIRIPKNATVSASFSAVAGEYAEPGKVAWNSFGYHYGLVDTVAELEAMPLTVGVKIPSVPTLKKQLVDDRNQPVKADKDAEFTFLIYEGEALSGYDTEKALEKALDGANRKYMKQTLTVGAGASESEAVTLKPGDSDDFQWKEGQKYTAVELTATTEQYHLSGFVGANKNITFTYHAESDTDLVCRNMLWQWKINLVKVDSTTVTEDSTTIAEDSDTAEQKKLPGAVFALYSPDEPDEQDKYTIPDKYSNLGIQGKITEGDTTWYLYSVQTTNDSGAISWEKLGQEKYYLLEVKAPDGYKLPKNPGQILTRSGAVHNIYNITVKNTPGYVLPETGGAGTLPYTIGGTLLLVGSLLSGYVLRRKRERRFVK